MSEPTPESILPTLPPAPDGSLEPSTEGQTLATRHGHPTGEAAATLPAGVGDPRALAGYVLEEEIGRGGMGVVYRARQVKLNRIVALKMILHADHASADERCFQREAASSPPSVL